MSAETPKGSPRATPVPPRMKRPEKVAESPVRRRKTLYKSPSKFIHPIRKQKTGGQSLTREAISIDQIKDLDKLFKEGEGLKEEDFIQEIHKLIPALSEHQVTELFLKVDANADGRVDWDELTSYMFVHSADEDLTSADTDTTGGRWRYIKGPDLHGLHNPKKEKFHRQPITKILYAPTGRGQFLTSSSDGTIRIWDHLTFQHRGVLFRCPQPINDMCFMPFSNKLVVARMDHIISFHDISSGGEHCRISGARLKQCNPLTIDCFHDPTLEREVLCIGDDTGGLQVYYFEDRMWRIRSYSVKNGARLEDLENISYRYIDKLHGDWVTKVKYIADVSALVTASLDGKCKVIDLVTLDRLFEEHEFHKAELKKKKEREKALERKAKDEGEDAYNKFLERKKNNAVREARRAKQRKDEEANLKKNSENETSFVDFVSAQESPKPSKTLSEQISNLFSPSRDSPSKPLSKEDRRQQLGDIIKYHSEKHDTVLPKSPAIKKLLHCGGCKQLLSIVAFAKNQVSNIKQNKPGLCKSCFKEQPEHKAVRHVFSNHKFGVYAFDWSSENRVVASCGIEREVLLWNPYSKRTIGVLECGLGSVTDLVVDDNKQRVICVDVTNTIRVFDLRTHKLIQTFQQDTVAEVTEDESNETLPANLSQNKTDEGGRYETNLRVGKIFFDRKHDLENVLLVATTQLFKWPSIPIATGTDENEMANLTEPKAISSVIYNPAFHQVVSVEAAKGKKPLVWNVETGELVSAFSESHGNSMITAMCFDKGGRRLVSGSHGGDNLLVWNFGNYRLLKKLNKIPQSNVIAEEEKLADDKHSVFKDQFSMTQSFMPGASYISLDGTEDEQDLAERSVGYKHGSWTLSTRRQMLQNLHERKHESFSFRKKFGREPGELDVKETTKIVYIETNTGGAHIQRFICCAGWDKKIYVWDDDEDQKGGNPLRTHRSHGYVSVMPRPNQSFHGHAEDITDMIDCNGSLVSCSSCGLVIFWNIQSGELIGKVNFKHSVLALAFIETMSLLVASTTDGMLNMINTVPPHTVVSSVYCMMAPDEYVSALKLDSSNRYLFAGGSEGHVQCYDVGSKSSGRHATGRKQHHVFDGTAAISVNGGIIRSEAIWKAHDDDITALDCVENPVVLDTFLITASHSAVIRLWTYDGAWVGEFGQSKLWDLDSPSTYRSLSPKLLIFKNSADEDDWSRVRNNRNTGLIHAASLRSDGKVDVSRKWKMPEVGDVWVRDHYQTRVTVDNAPCSIDGSAPAHFEHAEMITIIRVGREDIIGWDGNSTEAGAKRHCILADFDAHSNIPWRKEQTLTNLVGQVLECPDTKDLFKAVYCFQRNRPGTFDECQIVLRDQHFDVRQIPIKCSGHRSFSLYMLEKEREHEAKLFQNILQEQQEGEITATESTITNDMDSQHIITERSDSVPIEKLIGPEAEAFNTLVLSKRKYGKRYEPSKLNLKELRNPRCYDIRKDKRRDFGVQPIAYQLEDVVMERGGKIQLSKEYFKRKKKARQGKDQTSEDESLADKFLKSLNL